MLAKINLFFIYKYYPSDCINNKLNDSKFDQNCTVTISLSYEFVLGVSEGCSMIIVMH